MPKKIKTLLKNKQPWQWPSCKHPKTLSFRDTTNEVFKTFNSVFLDPSESYRFTNSSSECATTTTTTTTLSDDEEMIIRGVRLSDSERLFFEETSSSIVKEETPFNEEEINSKVVAVEMAMESENPYMDFKKSMAEMVESHGLIKDWDCLEELLGWYLKMNSSNNHAFIVAAFLDLLLPTNSSSTGMSCSDSTSYSSADSCFSSR